MADNHLYSTDSLRSINKPINSLDARANQNNFSFTDHINGGKDTSPNNRYIFPTDNFQRNLGWISFTELTQELDTDGLVLTTPRKGSSVYLYMPKEGLTVADKADYANAEFNITGTLAETIKREDVNIGTALEQTARAATDAAMVFSGQTKNIGIIAKVLQQTRMTNTPIGQGIRTRFGRTANPHVRAVFNQVSRRTFNYAFDLIPNNPKENDMIKKIIKFFRANMYPETENLQNEDGSVLLEDYVYKFPNKFDIEYWFDKTKVGHKLKHCFLTDVKVQYNNQGSMSFYPDGGFISSRIELTFTEERTISKKDVLDNSEGIGY